MEKVAFNHGLIFFFLLSFFLPRLQKDISLREHLIWSKDNKIRKRCYFELFFLLVVLFNFRCSFNVVIKNFV